MIEHFVFLAEFYLHTRTAGAKVVGGGGGGGSSYKRCKNSLTREKIR